MWHWKVSSKRNEFDLTFACMLDYSRQLVLYLPVDCWCWKIETCIVILPFYLFWSTSSVSSMGSVYFVQAINIEGLSVDKFLEYQVASCGWELEKGQSGTKLAILPRNEYNHPELKKNTADSIPFEHVTRIFPILSWPIIFRLNFVAVYVLEVDLRIFISSKRLVTSVATYFYVLLSYTF